MKKEIELAKSALMERRQNLACQMEDCNSAYKELDRLLDKELEAERQSEVADVPKA